MNRRLPNAQNLPNQFYRFQISASWQTEAYLERGVYLVIPRTLWSLVVQNVGSDRFAAIDQLRESEIAQAAGDDFGNIAIRNGAFISYADLSPVQPVQLTDDEAAFLGKNPAEAANLARVANERLNPINGVRRGYLGWLLTNPTFLREHNQLLQRHVSSDEEYDFPMPRLSSATLPRRLLVIDDGWLRSCVQFYERWRLQSLVLPYLPLPLPVQIPKISDPATGSPQEGVVILSVPDIYAVRGRGLIAEMLEDALRAQGAPDHLQEWFQIIKQSSTKANVLPMYGRWFRLQHYWRLLNRRYPQALRRKKHALVATFASFLSISVDSLKADLRRITDRLGDGWEQR